MNAPTTISLTNKRTAALHPCSDHPVFLDGTTWPTMIHYYYAQQLGDGQLRYNLQLTRLPDEALDIVNGAEDQFRIALNPPQARDVLHKACRAKVMQYARVRGALLRSADAPLVVDLTGCGPWSLEPIFAEDRLLADILTGIRTELTKDGSFDELKDHPIPPRLKYPGEPASSLGWRMGNGEQCLTDYYCWYRGLTPAGRKQHRQMYPPPRGWR